MRKFKALFVALCILKYTSSTTTTEVHQMEYSEGTSVEMRYSLPLHNTSSLSLNGSSFGNDYRTKSTLSRILDFYNTEMLAERWARVKESLSEGCQKDVEAYIQGLAKAENWALKSKYYVLHSIYLVIVY